MRPAASSKSAQKRSLCALLGLIGMLAAALADASVNEPDGAYLARAANCHSCHTADPAAPLAGGVSFSTPYGVLWSTNITPDTETGIGSWSKQDLRNAMRHGVRPNGEHLYPAFPYTAYALMSDAEIDAIYDFLMSQPAVRASSNPAQLTFPYNQRWLLGFWKTLFHDPAPFTVDPNQSASWNRGAYLVRGPGHCGACHTPRNLLGAERTPLALTGGRLSAKTKLGWERTWSSVNLHPVRNGLGSWSHQDLVDYLSGGLSARAVAQGPMREVIFNSTQHLSAADIDAMATYLMSLPANTDSSAEPSSDALQAGEVLYTVHCGSCHLPDGQGDPTLGVPLAGSAVTVADQPESLINIILYGPDLAPPPFSTGRSNMKMHGKRLSNADIADIATYIRRSWGNQAGAVTAEQVAAQR